MNWSSTAHRLNSGPWEKLKVDSGHVRENKQEVPFSQRLKSPEKSKKSPVVTVVADLKAMDVKGGED